MPRGLPPLPGPSPSPPGPGVRGPRRRAGEGRGVERAEGANLSRAGGRRKTGEVGEGPPPTPAMRSGAEPGTRSGASRTPWGLHYSARVPPPTAAPPRRRRSPTPGSGQRTPEASGDGSEPSGPRAELRRLAAVEPLPLFSRSPVPRSQLGSRV